MSKKVKKNKLKTNRGAAKRFKIRASGKVIFRSANRAHLKARQTSKQVRHARANKNLCPADEKMIHALLPYQV